MKAIEALLHRFADRDIPPLLRTRAMAGGSAHERYLCAGLIRLHLLHHAAHEPIYGLEMIEELGRHGYQVSAGTIYPILHGLEQRGLLVATEKQFGRTRRVFYRATPAGRRALSAAKLRVQALFSELVTDVARPLPKR